MNTDDPQAAYTPAPAPLPGDSAALFADVRRKMGTAAAVPAAPSFRRAADWFQLADVLDHAEALIARAEKAEAQAERLYPLVRHQREALHEANLIDNREYADLSAIGGSYILDSYDELRARTKTAEARVTELQAELAKQERAKLALIQETHHWSAAVKKLEAERVAPVAEGLRKNAQCDNCRSTDWDAMKPGLFCDQCADEDGQEELSQH